MKLHIDSHFTIGKTHKVCEDYVATYQGEQGAILALSDGCSSSPNSDIGSRLLVHKALSLFKEGVFSEQLVILGAQKIADDLIIPSCTDATLLTLRTNNENNNFVIDVWGDGAVFFEFKDGSYQLMTASFTNNMPSYLSYLIDQNRLTIYLRDYGDRIIETNSSKYGSFIAAKPVKDSYGWQLEGAFSDVKKIILFSDGIQSFKSKETKQPIPAISVVEQIAAIKNSTGFYMVRRMKKFLTECGWEPDDDVSVASLVVEE